MLAVKVLAECRLIFLQITVWLFEFQQILDFELPVSDLQWFS